MVASHFVILGLTSLVYVTYADEVVLPGAKVRLAQNGLDYAAKKAIEKLNLKGQLIPDQHGKDRIKRIRIEYWLTGMVIKSFAKPATTVTVTPGKGITWTATGASSSIHGNWRYKFLKLKDHGSFDLNADDIGFSISLILGISENGQPTIKTTGCSSNVNLKVKFHGGASKLYNLFDRKIAKPLKKSLADMMCKAATKIINVDAQDKLVDVVLISHVGKNNEMTLDYSWTQAPVFNPGYMDVMLKGKFEWTKEPSSSAFTPAPFPASTDASKMVYIWGSEYVVNSYINVAFRHHLLQINVSRSDFSEGEGDFLKTTCPSQGCIGNYLIEVTKKFPGVSVMVEMEALKSPYIQITPDKINFHAEGEMLLYADVTLLGKVSLFKLKVSVDMNVTARIEGTFVKGEVESAVPKIQVLDSTIGVLTEPVLNGIFKMIADKYIVEHLNELGEKGVMIPNMKNCHYVDPVLKFNTGNLEISADLIYERRPATTTSSTISGGLSVTPGSNHAVGTLGLCVFHMIITAFLSKI